MTTNEKALALHEKLHGKLETVSKVPVKSREDLALAYTPGVAEPCKVIAQDKEAAKAALLAATSELDKAASKGVYHKNTASRKISRLSKAVNGIA